MKSYLVLILALTLALGGSCQQATKAQHGTQQQFFAAVKPSGLATDQALRSAHYFKIAGRRDLALKELSAAVALDPKNTRLLNALGACYDEYGDHAKAQQVFQQVLQLDPENVAALNNLGHSFYLAGDMEQAEATLQAVLAKDPNHKWARNNLGLVWCKVGKSEQARQLWEKIDGEAQAHDKLGRVMASLGKPLPPGATPAPAPTAIALSPAALPARLTASASPSQAQAPAMAEARRQQSEPALVQAAKVAPAPTPAKTAEAPAKGKLEPVALIETVTMEVAPAAAPLPPLATTPETSAPSSRAKTIEVAAEPQQPVASTPEAPAVKEKLQPVSLTETVTMEVAPAAAPLPPLATTPETPAPSSRAKILELAAEPQQPVAPPQQGPTVAEPLEKYQLAVQPRVQSQVQLAEPTKPAPPKLAVRIPSPEEYRVRAANLEIRNGIGVRRLAKNMRRLLRYHGYNVAIAGNHVDFGVPETVVYFRSFQEETARAINDNFLKAKRLIRKDNLRPEIDIKIVLGHDLFQNNENLAPFQATGPQLSFGPQLAMNP